MGKQRFRLSHMIPNAWFYRLRDMNTATHNKKPLPSAYSSTRNSVCYTPRLYPYNNISPTNTINNPAVAIYTSPTELTHNTHHQHLFLSPTSTSYYESPFSESTRSLDKPPSTSCSCGVISSSTTTDVVIEFNEKSYTKKIQDSSAYELIKEIDLQKPPPIKTKSNNIDKIITMDEKKEEISNQSSSISIKIVKESISKKENPVSGVEIRSNSSKTQTPICKRIVDVNNDEKNNLLSSSCCIVKSSFDPQKDFKESMVEMILEDKIWDSKDLEKLLASYLSLNSNEYHEMIIKAFEEIWLSFEFVD